MLAWPGGPAGPIKSILSQAFVVKNASFPARSERLWRFTDEGLTRHAGSHGRNIVHEAF